MHIAWGRHKENGVWRASVPRRRLMWHNHDSLYIALGRNRLRLMKSRRWRRQRR